MSENFLKITSCVDCPNCLVENDPDPYDSFYSDDLKARCRLSTNAPILTEYGIGVGNPYITVACRPDMLRKETEIPDWCPIKGK